MKKHFFRMLSVALCFALIAAIALPACARASDYFSAYTITASAKGSGIVRFGNLVNGTKTMQEIGFTKIAVYEYQTSSSSYVNVYNYTTSNTTSMTVINDDSHARYVDYKGTPGKIYYATVTLYAKDASGSEKLSVNTNIVTAT